jgi:hypothetical protein
MRGVTLLARRLAVGFQDSVDKANQRPDYRPLALGPRALRRLGARQCLTHHPAVDAQLARNPLYRPDAEVVFPPNLLE